MIKVGNINRIDHDEETGDIHITDTENAEGVTISKEDLPLLIMTLMTINRNLGHKDPKVA